MRVRGGGRLLAPGAPLALASGASTPRITVGVSNEEMRAIGRRSQRRWARRSALRLGLGAIGVALLGAGTTWALLRGVPGAARGEAENRLAASVENAITRAIARAEQPTPPAANAAASDVGASNAVSSNAQASVAGASSVSANVPRLRLDTLLRNADFEGLPNCNDGDLKPWQVWSGGRNSGLGSAFAVGTGKEQDARSGRWRLVFWKSTPYEASVSQIVRNLRPGLYQLNAWTKRSGGQEWAGIVIANYGGPRIHYLVPASRRWTPIAIRNIRVTGRQCKIGFYTRSPRGKKWLAVDAVEFQRQN